MRIPIVDEQDQLIKHIDRKDRDPKEITRIAALWVVNEKGEFLVAKRSKNKKHQPNIWGPSVAGTVEEGETYEDNIRKEAQEEIGVTLNEITLGPKVRHSTSHEYFGQYFFATVDSTTKFVLRPAEVDEVRWISIPELETWYSREPENFTPSFNNSIEIIKNYENKN